MLQLRLRLVDCNGNVSYAVNLPWLNTPLKNILEEKLETSVIVENDAKAAALGEFYFGVGTGATKEKREKAGDIATKVLAQARLRPLGHRRVPYGSYFLFLKSLKFSLFCHVFAMSFFMYPRAALTSRSTSSKP